MLFRILGFLFCFSLAWPAWGVSVRIKAGDIYDIDIARQAVVGWVDVVDEGGQPVEFSPDVLEQLLGIPGVAAAAMRQYFELRNGGPEKNSPSSGDTSPERNAQ